MNTEFDKKDVWRKKRKRTESEESLASKLPMFQLNIVIIEERILLKVATLEPNLREENRQKRGSWQKKSYISAQNPEVSYGQSQTHAQRRNTKRKESLKTTIKNQKMPSQHHAHDRNNLCSCKHNQKTWETWSMKPNYSWTFEVKNAH